MTDHESPGSQLDATSREAERLIEERIEELRAAALGGAAAAGGGIAGAEDPMAAVLRPAPAQTASSPAAERSWATTPVGSYAEPAAAAIEPPAHLRAVPDVEATSAAPVPHAAPAVATPTYFAPAPSVTPRMQSLVDRSSIEQFAGLITASASRVETAVQEDLARLEELLRQWGQPNEPVLTSLQRIERSLRTDLARLLEAIHTVPISEQDVAHHLALLMQEGETRTADRFVELRSEFARMNDSLESSIEEMSRTAGSAAAIAGAGIGDRVTRSVGELSDGLIDKVALLQQHVEGLASLLGADSQQVFSQRMERLDATLRTSLGNLQSVLEGDVEAFEVVADSLGKMADTVERMEQVAVDSATATEAIQTSIAASNEKLQAALSRSGERVQNAISRSGDQLSTATDSMRETVTTAADSVRETVNTATDSMRETVSTSLDSVRETVNSAVGSVRESASSLDTAIETMEARISRMLEDAQTAVASIPSAESLGSAVGNEVTDAHSELRAWLEERITSTEDTLLLAQDEVPEELAERFIASLSELRDEMEVTFESTNNAVSSVVDTFSTVLSSLRDEFQRPQAWQQEIVRQITETVRDSVNEQLATSWKEQEERLLRMHREFVSELDYNRLKQAQDHEGIIDSLFDGWNAMGSRLDRLEQRLGALDTHVTSIGASTPKRRTTKPAATKPGSRPAPKTPKS